MIGNRGVEEHMVHNSKLHEIHLQQTKLSELRWSYWSEEVFFSFQWFFLVISTLVLVYLWIKILDRSRLLSILLFSSLVFIIASTLDTIGGELQFWEYPYMILPWGLRILSIDLMISIFYSLLFQYVSKWKPFILGSILIAFIFAFVFENVAIWLNIYAPIVWEHIYSFPIFILIPLIGKKIVDSITSASNEPIKKTQVTLGLLDDINSFKKFNRLLLSKHFHDDV